MRSKFLSLLAFCAVAPAAEDLLPRQGTLPDLVIPPVEYLAPAEAMKTFSLHPDYQIELVAHEPSVIAPIEVMFDELGRMWVLEMQDYMPNVEGDGEGGYESRVIVLEDVDRDGSYEKRTVFLQGLSLPRAMARVNDGIMLAEDEIIWHCIDLDGDLRCDDRRRLQPFGTGDNIEHAEATLTWNIDNWYYSAKSKRRFQFAGGKMVAEDTYVMLGQWGLTRDDYGRLYSNANPTFLRRLNDFPPHYAARVADRDKKAAQYQVDITTKVDSIRVNPGVRGGHHAKILDERGHLDNATAVSGLAAYRGGGGWPDAMIGALLMTEPAGNTAPLFTVKFDDFNAKLNKVMTPSAQYGDHDFLASTDELFRPVNVESGPDGCMYVVDMRAPILQHKRYMTPYLANQIRTRGLNRVSEHGRIYRITHRNGQPDRNYPQLVDADAQTLVNTLSHRNGFWRDQAQRLLVEGDRQDAVPLLLELATASGDTLPRMHALWALHGLYGVTVEAALSCLASTDRDVKLAAMRVSEDYLASEGKLRGQVLALINDPDPLLRVQAIYSLGEVAIQSEVRRKLLAVSADDAETRAALMNSLGEAGSRALEDALASGKSADFIRDLAAQITYRRDPDLIREGVEEVVAIADIALQQAAVEGLAQGLRGALPAFMRNKKKDETEPVMKPGPVAIKPVMGFEKIMAHPAMAKAANDLAIYAHWGAGGAPVERDPEVVASYERGKGLFAAKACFGCHGPDAKGGPLAPSLYESPIVAGEPNVAIKVILHGLMGKRVVAGQEYNGMMPPAAAMLNDQELADILTWLRVDRSSDDGQAVPAATVKDVRAEYGDRSAPWMAAELGY